MASTLEIDPTNSWQQIQTTIEGQDYLLELAWNTRDERWYVSLYKADGTCLVASVAMVVDFPLFRKTVGPDIPKGYFMAVDTAGNGAEIAAQEELGVRVQLTYLTEAEVDAEQ
jgi:hypothetical protein